MGVLAMQNKDYKAASEYFAKSDVQEAKWNQGAIEVLNGNYEAALACLKGSNLPNEALVYILLKQEDKAAPLLTCKCPADAYKRAIVAARKGDAAKAKKELDISRNEMMDVLKVVLLTSGMIPFIHALEVVNKCKFDSAFTLKLSSYSSTSIQSGMWLITHTYPS